MAGRVPVVVDCDPGHDDAVALLLADVHADLLGITTVGGNAPLAAVTRNALITCELFGIEAPVHAGAARPLVAPPRFAAQVHGEHGFGGSQVPDPTRLAAPGGAVAFLIDTARRVEGLWLIATGPLTNVALALRSAPDLADRLAGISFMGGSATVGNHTPVAEFNALVDPEALDVVLGSGVPLRMAGLDLTYQFVVDASLEADVRAVGTPGAVVVADLLTHYLGFLASTRPPRAGGLHDPCAVLAVTHPDLVERTPRHVSVELAGRLTRGMTVVDRRGPGIGEAPNVEHGHHLDHDPARTVVLDALAARGRGVGSGPVLG
jgi:inosine-uridine nucleoside N-ribohydrolase